MTAVPVRDDRTGQLAVLVSQSDVTERHELERRLVALTEAQLTMLEHIFPRCVCVCV